MRKFVSQLIRHCVLLAVMPLTGCSGILSGVYDEPPSDEGNQVAASGKLYIDASSWTHWHFIDLDEVVERTETDSLYKPNSSWVSYSIPTGQSSVTEGKDGIYTYWYDVFGEGISKCEFRDYYPTEAQLMPGSWTFAVHRNNVMTNGCMVAKTDFDSFDQLPADKSAYDALTYVGDTWNESDVWVIQDQMLLGLIGCQGITVNECLSSWLNVEIPPVPPAFTLNSKVFILKTPEGKLAALQLENYQSATGTKCVLTINYKYPL